MTTQLETFFKDQGLRPFGTLVHWGVLGMKWGIRRSDAELARASGGSGGGSGNISDSERAAATQKQINSGGVSSVSDSDLNHLLNRINLEKRYADVESSTSTLSKGHSAIKSFLKVGTTMNNAITFANSDAGKIIHSYLKSGSSKYLGTTRPRHTAGKHAR